MTTVLEPAPGTEIDKRIVLYDVDWNAYERMLQIVGDNRLRLTYDGRNLELMSPSPIHESYKSLFGRLLEALAYDLNIPIRTGGSMTFRRSNVNRGLEPDECYWIQRESLVRGSPKIDLDRDPPPDLFIEIDISRGPLDRMEICARLQVPEVWRFDGEALRIYLLQPDGKYAESPTSNCLPFLPIRELLPFLELDPLVDETTRARQFVARIRQCRQDGQPASPRSPERDDG